MQELDKNGRPYKCGPNWAPDVIYNEVVFQQCCATHDKEWENKSGKFASDFAFFKCCLGRAKNEEGWWKIRAYAQAVLMYSILLLNPVSYIIYYTAKVNNRYGKE